jgi:hypothetical protein
VATLCYADFLRKQGYKQKIRRVTLIEPSEAALKRAALHVSVFFPDAEIVTINKGFDDLETKDIVCDEDVPTLHLLSNVLDLECFSLAAFMRLLNKTIGPSNMFICVGPYFGEESDRSKRMDWFNENLIVIFPDIKSSSIFDDMYSNDRFKTFAEDILRGLDVGVDGIEFKKETISEFLTEAPLVEARQLEEMKKNIDEDRAGILDTAHFTASLAKENGQYYVRRVITNHVADGKNYTFELKEESDGTQRLMDFIPMIKELDTADCTYFVDEINKSIHPNTMWDMMSKLMSGKSSGQLVCSSHESNLLSCEIFRTDEIWFAEKRHEDQSTAMYPLSDFKPRNDLDIRKGYLKGRFGAIPFLSKTDDLKWETGDAVQE